jgi:hypothetical protein
MITLYIYCYVTLNPKSNLNVSVKAQNGFQRSDSTLFFWVLILKKIEPRNEDSLSINFRLLFFYFMSLMCAWDHSLLWALLVSYGHFTIVCHWHIIYHFVLFDPNSLLIFYSSQAMLCPYIIWNYAGDHLYPIFHYSKNFSILY